MKLTLGFLLLFALPLVAQRMFCPQHEEHTSASANHQAEVEKHGDEGMGFSHEKTTHHFLLYADGGAIQVLANDGADSQSVQQIRAHLTHIATMFSEGNFAIPMFIHSQVPPGVPTMKQERANITYTFEEAPGGGRVRIQSGKAEAVKAIHEFLRFQIEDHHTGDSMATSSPLD